LDSILACSKEELNHHLECQQDIIKNLLEERAVDKEVNCQLKQQVIQLQAANMQLQTQLLQQEDLEK